MKHRLLISICCCATLFSATARTTYATRYNDFAPLEAHFVTDGDYLIDENKTSEPQFNLDTTCIVPGTDIRYFARLANRHNKAGKAYRSDDGTKTVNPEWGLVFDYLDIANYRAVILQCHNSALHDDITDRRTLTVTLVEVIDGERTEIARATLDKEVALDDGLNVAGVETSGSDITVCLGRSERREVLHAVVATRPSAPSRVGLYAGPAALLAVERTMLERKDATGPARLMTQWTREALDNRFADSFDPVEGYWTYLDRDLDDKVMRAGGKYTLALVASEDNGYDIIYVDGATVYPGQWTIGMLKGHLTPTIFDNTYTAIWYDAMGQPFTDDVQATVENTVILTVKLPIYKSQIRFSRVISQY